MLSLILASLLEKTFTSIPLIVDAFGIEEVSQPE
jgi:hypothetical protein